MDSLSVDATDDRIHQIVATIRVIPNFPKPWILFQDITRLLLDPKAFEDTIDLFVERYKDKNINIIAGCLSPYKLSCNFGEYGTTCSSPECICITTSAELHIYTDFRRLVLEILNAILTYSLPRNYEVIYAIMCGQEVFLPFKNHPRFNELLENIYNIFQLTN